MTTALRSLEKLRADAVDRARAELAQARVALAHAEQLVREQAAQLEQLAARLEEARSRNDLLTSSDLAWAERSQRAALMLHERGRARLEAAQTRRAQEVSLLKTAERRLLDAELGRRTVAQVVAKREIIRAKHQELRTEEEAADAHRTRTF